MTLPDRISAALLLAQPASADVPALRVHLNTVLGPSGLHFDQRPARHGYTLEADGVTLELRERDLPLQPARLDAALQSRLPQLLHEDWATLAARHRAAICIDLQCDRAARAGTQAEAGPATDPSRELFDLGLMAAQAATAALAQGARPLAVYWAQSERLFPTTRFLAMQRMLFPLPLFLHPRPVGKMPDDPHDLPEFEIVGASDLIGTSLRVAPARARFDWMMKRVLAFVSHLRASQSLPTDGMTFALESGERLVVRQLLQGGLGLVLEERNGRPVQRDGAPFVGEAA